VSVYGGRRRVEKVLLHVNFPNNLIFLPDRKERLGFSKAKDGIIPASTVRWILTSKGRVKENWACL
jgi:hypothetical protein